MSKVKSLIPNLITAGNLVGGILAIIFSLTGHLEWAPYCIFISAFLDFFDGFAARLLKVQSEMGKQLDSLADMVTFGVAPGVMVFVFIKLAVMQLFLHENAGVPLFSDQVGLVFLNSEIVNLQTIEFIQKNLGYNDNFLVLRYFYLPFVALIIPVMSMFRLAKFNLDTRQTDSFIGLPTPANTLFFAAIPLIVIQVMESGIRWQQDLVQHVFLNPWFLSISVLIMSYLLVAELPLFALKFNTFGWKGNEIRYIFLTLCVLMLATLWWLAIPLIIILYILLSIIQNLTKK